MSHKNLLMLNISKGTDSERKIFDLGNVFFKEIFGGYDKLL